MLNGQTLKCATSDYDQRHVIAFRPISVAARSWSYDNRNLLFIENSGSDRQRKQIWTTNDKQYRQYCQWTITLQICLITELLHCLVELYYVLYVLCGIFVLVNWLICEVSFCSVMSAEHVSEIKPKPGDKYLGFITSVCCVISCCRLILWFQWNLVCR